MFVLSHNTHTHSGIVVCTMVCGSFCLLTTTFPHPKVLRPLPSPCTCEYSHASVCQFARVLCVHLVSPRWQSPRRFGAHVQQLVTSSRLDWQSRAPWLLRHRDRHSLPHPRSPTVRLFPATSISLSHTHTHHLFRNGVSRYSFALQRSRVLF